MAETSSEFGESSCTDDISAVLRAFDQIERAPAGVCHRVVVPSGILLPGSLEVHLIFPITGGAVLSPQGRPKIELAPGSLAIWKGGRSIPLRWSADAEVLVFRVAGSMPCQIRFFGGRAKHEKRSPDLHIASIPIAGNRQPVWGSALRFGELVHQIIETDEEGAVDLETVGGQIVRAGRAMLEDHRNAMARSGAGSAAERMAAADLYLYQEIARNSLKKEDLARHLQVSTSLLTLDFRACGGLGVREHIILRRYERARIKLAETDRSVASIAESIGSNYQHFIRTFNGLYGISPLRFRKLVRSGKGSAGSDERLYQTNGFETLAAGASPPAGAVEGAETCLLLFSNAGGSPLLLVREREGGGGADDVALLAPGRRLLFIESRGVVWRVEGRETGDGGSYRCPGFNAHVIAGESRGGLAGVGICKSTDTNPQNAN